MPLRSAREVIKGHPYCGLKPHAVMPLLTRHTEERYCEGVLLFDVRGSLPSTCDVLSGGDHGQGAFTHTLSVVNQTSNQARRNSIFLCKADQKDNYADLEEMTGHHAPILEQLEREGVTLNVKEASLLKWHPDVSH